MKMKNCIFVVMLAVLFPLMAVSGAVKAQSDPIHDATKAENVVDEWKVTWSTKFGHLEKDHKFEIAETDDGLTLTPLGALATAWGFSEPAGLELKNGWQCAMVEVTGHYEHVAGHGNRHAILVKILDPTENKNKQKLLIRWSPMNIPPGAEPDETYCSVSNHGGMAHANRD